MGLLGSPCLGPPVLPVPGSVSFLQICEVFSNLSKCIFILFCVSFPSGVPFDANVGMFDKYSQRSHMLRFVFLFLSFYLLF